LNYHHYLQPLHLIEPKFPSSGAEDEIETLVVPSKVLKTAKQRKKNAISCVSLFLWEKQSNTWSSLRCALSTIGVVGGVLTGDGKGN
jgi:hypothetical protein